VIRSDTMSDSPRLAGVRAPSEANDTQARRKVERRNARLYMQALILGVTANLAWGVLPIFWKHLRHIPAPQLLAHRVIWSMLLVPLLARPYGLREAIRACSTRPATLLMSTLIASTMGVNWLIYIWAIGTGRVMEASLGYYISPLFAVLLAYIVLKEPLSRLQVIATSIVAAGVLFLVLSFGHVPWVGFILAASFATFALLRKRAAVSGIQGFMVEISMLAPIALGYLLYASFKGEGVFEHETLRVQVMLVASGVVSGLPLILFCHAAERLRLTTLGLIQYIMPTCQLILAVTIFHEPFSMAHGITFACIWVALGLYTLDGHRSMRAAPT
jgi:chloramphenicol-sensitive protein RarD